ncbi:peptide chain release factor N(5)-glutamine methyltransferase [Spongorhabdus nitratireducens]
MSSVSDLLKAAEQQLVQSPTARLDAELLLCHVLDKSRTWLMAWSDETVSEENLEQFEHLLQRRVTGEPVAHLTGRRDFWTLELEVSADTLIPRPDTELLVELALEYGQRGPHKVVDLGTGTGAIALALASERPEWLVNAVERNPDTLAVARRNALSNKLERVQFFEGSWFEPLPDNTRFQLIVSNPPYIPDSDPHLKEGDVRFEPLQALASGNDGLDDILQIVSRAPEWLEADGWLLLEHGYDQGEAVRNIMQASGFQQVMTRQDLAGHDRVTLGQRPDFQQEATS